MKVKPLQMSEILSQCDNIYIATNIVSSRIRQIIDSNYFDFDSLEEDEFDDSGVINDINIPIPENKALVEAMDTFINKDLEWTVLEKNEDPEE